MFQQFINKLAQVERFDRVVNTEDIQFGAVAGPADRPQLALRLPSDEVVTLEERALANLGSQWGVPPAHLGRLPIELAIAELSHFARNTPRDITVRTIRESGQQHLVARAVLSSRYECFDTRQVLESIEPFVRGFEVSHAVVERDEARFILTMPGCDFDVSSRRVGDLVKAGLSISNSEIGTMSLRCDLSLLRLVCTNGMTTADSLGTRVRHIHISRDEFIARLRNTVRRAGQVGEQVARRLEQAHHLALPDLNPDSGKLQREVVAILRRASVWTDTFAHEAEKAVREGGGSLFELIQFITDAKRLSSARLADRVHAERVGGRLAALAA